MRTRGNVKSSAMIPRHPEVPNLIATSLMVFAAGVLYLGRALLACGKRLAAAKSKGNRRSMARAKSRKIGAVVVLVTCGSRSEAGRIARAVVSRNLAACVNI